MRSRQYVLCSFFIRSVFTTSAKRLLGEGKAGEGPAARGMIMQKVQIESVNLENGNKDFGLFDFLGRGLGAGFVISEETRTPDETSNRYSNWIGTRFALQRIVKRAGDPFGAMQSKLFFPTIESAREAAQQYLAEAEKRAVRKWSA